MVKKKTKTVLECTCELPGCGKSWESQGPDIPARCRHCGRHTWNNTHKRHIRPVTARGKTQSITEWARETGIGKATIRLRLELGWTPEEAVGTAVGAERRKV